MSNIKLMVCPHDTAKNPENWFNFSLYLTKAIGNSFLFEKSIDFPDFHDQLTSGGLIYANPQDSVKLIKEHNYSPVARPINLSDEIVFIASKGLETPQVTDLTDKVITSVESMMVTKVGIKCLLENNIKPASIESKESWMAVVKSIFRNEADYAMVYKDFYEGLNNLSKSGLQKIGETTDGTIHHNLLVSPNLIDSITIIQETLVKMHEDTDAGQKILAALNIEKLVAVSKDEILKFEALQVYQVKAAETAGETAPCC